MKYIIQSFFIFCLFTMFCCSCSGDKNIITYYETGEIQEEYQYKGDSIKHGTYRRFSQEGILVETANYIDDKLNGERILYNYQNGVKEVSEIYKSDFLNGRHIVYHFNGEVQSIGMYQDNKLSGSLRFFDTSGILKDEFQFVDNFEVIPFKEYHDNGQIKWEGNKRYDHYFNTKKDFGELREYNEDGILIRKIKCDEREICTTIWTIDGSHHKE